MDRYLETHFKGQYRIFAELDQDTQDFVRNDKGEYEESFGDFYIKGSSKIKIKHGCGSELSCYIPSFGKGMNILRQIYTDKIEPFDKDKHDNEHIAKQLVKKGILVDCDLLDGEIYFIFKANMIDYIADLVGAKTSGAKISPFSVKNLPKEVYIIPEQDENKYKKLIKDLEMAQINQANRQFIFDHKIEKNKKLKQKQQIHKAGLWNEYCEFLKGWK